MYQAAQVVGNRDPARAAIATTAHDVLYEYFPGSAAQLDADLADSLADVPDGPAERVGVQVGTRIADRMFGSRKNDGRGDTARFFNSNSAIMVTEGLLGYLDARPMRLTDTARLFAAMHTAMSDSIIICRRLKYDVGFWRPFQAIQLADTDGNPATIADPTWTPLLGYPPYSDYVSGHGCLTAPAVQAIRRTLGEQTSLDLHSYVTNTRSRIHQPAST